MVVFREVFSVELVVVGCCGKDRYVAIANA